jgi:DNA polymerase I-like protein with 3'-5' exonuclease and polymerase domains
MNLTTQIFASQEKFSGRAVVMELQDGSQFLYVKDHKLAMALINALDPEQVYALDFETTSLFPGEGEVRLTSICGPGVKLLLDHKFCGQFFQFADRLAAHCGWAVFNSLFEGDWFDSNCEENEVVLYDVGHMRRAKMGGGPLSLKIQAKKDLNIELVKDEQNSRWSDPNLTESQLVYAMFDSVVTFALWEKWIEELSPEQWRGFLVINDAWRGTLEMQQTGLQLDVAYHATLVAHWQKKHDLCERYLRRWTPDNVLPNLRSKKQISDFLKRELSPATVAAWPKTEAREQLDQNSATLRQAAHRLPYPFSRWLASLVRFNYYEKYLSTYGQKLIDVQNRLGYVPTRFNMAQAVTGRYSSSAENLQNIPRKKVVRRSFIARRRNSPNKGIGTDVRLVMADYSSIEVRVLAELAQDKVLLHEAIYGNVHARSAASIFGIEFEHFLAVLDGDDPKHDNIRPLYKDMRSRAKAFTFQLLYGAGASALAVPLRCTDEEAFDAIDAWASVYPKAYHYRTLMYEKMMHSGFLPVCDGRTIFVHKMDRRMPVAANWPIQGAAASVMYRAVLHVNNLFRASRLRAQMAASVHDELLMFSHLDDAEETGKLLIAGMESGWLDIFPGTDYTNLIGEGNKATIGLSWGDKA